MTALGNWLLQASGSPSAAMAFKRRSQMGALTRELLLGAHTRVPDVWKLPGRIGMAFPGPNLDFCSFWFLTEPSGFQPADGPGV